MLIAAPSDACIQYNSSPLCFAETSQIFVSPDVPSTIVNPKKVPITVIPLYESIYSIRMATISLDSIHISHYCSISFDFRNRREIVNTLLLSKTVPISNYYIIGDHHDFISFIEAGNYLIQKFPLFSSRPHSQLTVVTNSLQVCSEPFLISFMATNPIALNKRTYWYKHTDAVYIPLPCPSIYRYHIATRDSQNRIIRSRYEVIRTQGVISNKRSDLESESLRVRGSFE